MLYSFPAANNDRENFDNWSRDVYVSQLHNGLFTLNGTVIGTRTWTKAWTMMNRSRSLSRWRCNLKDFTHSVIYSRSLSIPVPLVWWFNDTGSQAEQAPGPRHGQMGCRVLCRTFHTAPKQGQGLIPIVPHSVPFPVPVPDTTSVITPWMHHLFTNRQTDKQTHVPLSCWQPSHTRRTRPPGTVPRWRRIPGSPRTPRPPARCRMQRVLPCSTAPGQEISHSINHSFVTCSLTSTSRPPLFYGQNILH